MSKRLLKQTLLLLVAALVAAAGCGTAYAADNDTEQAIPAVSGVELPTLIPAGAGLNIGHAADDGRPGSAATGTGIAGAGLILGHAAEETRLAHQWAESVSRARHCPDPATWTPFAYEKQKGHAFEVMSRDANNARRPRNQATLEVTSNAEAVDGQLQNGRKIQMKASATRGVQSDAVKKLDAAGHTDGEVWVTKGDKMYPNPRVKESPVSQERVRRASQATARAETTAAMVRKGAKLGGVTSAVVEAGVQAFGLWSKRGEGITLADWTEAASAVAVAGGCGAAAGAAGVYSGTVSSAAVTPAGGAAVGLVVVGVTYLGCEFGVGKILGKLF